MLSAVADHCKTLCVRALRDSVYVHYHKARIMLRLKENGAGAHMRIAIPVWHGQVSTVFDFARRLLVVDVDDVHEMYKSEVSFEPESLIARVRTLHRLETDVLICGSISRDVAAMVASNGIEIVPFVKGPVDEVLAAFLADQIDDPRFLLSGSALEARQQETFKTNSSTVDADYRQE